jgi:hypothetical protein
VVGRVGVGRVEGRVQLSFQHVQHVRHTRTNNSDTSRQEGQHDAGQHAGRQGRHARVKRRGGKHAGADEDALRGHNWHFDMVRRQT